MNTNFTNVKESKVHLFYLLLYILDSGTACCASLCGSWSRVKPSGGSSDVFYILELGSSTRTESLLIGLSRASQEVPRFCLSPPC